MLWPKLWGGTKSNYVLVIFFIPQNTGSSSVSAVGIFVGIVLIALVLLGAVFGYKRYRDNRYKRKRNSLYNL